MWYHKHPADHVAGASKWLGKSISAGTQWLGRVQQHVGDLKDKYALMKKQGLDYLTNQYSRQLADLAKQGVGFLEGQASRVASEATPMLSLGSAVGKAFADYGT